MHLKMLWLTMGLWKGSLQVCQPPLPLIHVVLENIAPDSQRTKHPAWSLSPRNHACFCCQCHVVGTALVQVMSKFNMVSSIRIQSKAICSLTCRGLCHVPSSGSPGHRAKEDHIHYALSGGHGPGETETCLFCISVLRKRRDHSCNEVKPCSRKLRVIHFVSGSCQPVRCYMLENMSIQGQPIAIA